MVSTASVGGIDYSDWGTREAFNSIVAGWANICPTASAATCTASESVVECVVWEAVAVSQSRKRTPNILSENTGCLTHDFAWLPRNLPM